jgi:cytidine deaminase
MLTNKSHQELVKAASEARQRAYAPYSHYPVGAAVLTHSGKIFTGANIENASYPAGICAERVAVFKAVSEGESKFAAVAVVTGNGGAPCGICRQVIAEFGLDTEILIADQSGKIRQAALLKDLLPHAFTPNDLKA